MPVARLRDLVVLLIVAGLAAGLVACGGGGDSASEGTAGEVESRSGGEGGAAPKGKAEAGGKAAKGGAGQGASQPSGEGAGADGESSEEGQEVKQTAERFYGALAEEGDVDSSAFCDLMTEEAQAQFARLAEASAGGRKDLSCTEAIDLLSRRSGGFQGAEPPVVVGVEVNGNRATASVRVGKGRASSVSLVKEDGEWKLAFSTGAARR